MDVANLILPVFAVIATGWLAGATGYLPRALAGSIVQFAYNVAMPALVFLTIAQSRFEAMLDLRFLAAFGGGSALTFLAVSLAACFLSRRNAAGGAMLGAAASMTNTGFVALPILQALYGPQGVLPAAIATAFIAIALFPPMIVLLEADGQARQSRGGAIRLLWVILVNPVMLSTLAGLVWSALRLPLPAPVAAYARIFGDALTPCALFAVGLSLSLADLRGFLGTAAVVTLVKLVVMPAVVYGIAVWCGLGPTGTVAAVVCAAVPTAKTAYMLAGAYRTEEPLVASAISLTTLLSIVTLLVWLAVLL